jgi:uncharacterized protein (TIGR03067 family)
MKKRTHLNLALLASALLAAIAGCSKPESAKPTIDGHWVGFDVAQPNALLTAEFKGGQFKYWDAQTNELGSGTYTENETAQPTQMDLTFQTSVVTQYVGKVALAIYELKGNEVKFASYEPGSPQRPTDFAGVPGVRILTWKRE